MTRATTTSRLHAEAPPAAEDNACPSAAFVPLAPTAERVTAWQKKFIENLFFHRGRFPEVASRNDIYLALAYTVRDHLLRHWVQSGRTYRALEARTVCYFSAEYLLGPHLGNMLACLGLMDVARAAMANLGHDLDALMEHEEEPGLGNGGLGRLAACFLDSLTRLQVPAIGYGLRYEFGIFDQMIRDGWQTESSDKWLQLGNPWEIHQPEIVHEVQFGGRTESFVDYNGRYRVRWLPQRVVRGVAYDTPLPGYGVPNANLLRLWKAEACESLHFGAFNEGDYFRAVTEKIESETLTKVLYPNDSPPAGKRLRLQQQYFFVSCSLQDMIRIYLQKKSDLAEFHRKWTIQLNDTHPSLAIPELMRLFIDVHGMDWEPAWSITQQTCAYTNHTLLPEALEKWPLPMFQELLPRHLEIIYEINRRFLDDVRLRYLETDGRLARLSLIDETPPRYVRMAHLACVGSHTINGVARLHSRLLGETVLRDFYELEPEKFQNKTNGVTPRRFLLLANPPLARLLDAAVGRDWVTDLDKLRGLEPLADDAGFQDQWRQVRQENKRALAARIQAAVGVAVDPQSLFDVQIKRIHEYKRQHLNILHAIALYARLRHGQEPPSVPRTVIFAGKAAPGYFLARLIIKLIHGVADVVNRDPAVRDRLKIVFLPDYNVKQAQHIFPAADLSEQISTAGMEASGTGNMKMALNGALTIGTLDGANIEIREHVGAENFFHFGLTVEEAAARRASYDPRQVYERDPALREALDLIACGHFSHGDGNLFRPLLEALLRSDHFLVLADFAAYAACQQRVEQAWRDTGRWTRMSILNTARSGYFSSDRAIREYCRDIWRVQSVQVPWPE